MLGKTHMATGIAATLAVTQPSTIPEIVLATSVGAVGSLISDIDAGSSGSHKEAGRITLLAFIAVAVVFGLDHFAGMGIVQKIQEDSNMFRIVCGSLLFIGVCAFGKEQPHRSFMHSLLALVLLCGALGMIFPAAVPFFAVGFMSHLVADMFNYKKVKLFYPLKGGIAFKMCYANSFANKVLLVIASIVAISEIVILTFKTI